MNKPKIIWIIEELNTDHDRSVFSCGVKTLDNFLIQYARQNQKSGVCKTYVAIHAGDKTVRGYYSLSASSVHFKDIPDELRKRIPRYPIPTAHLGRLAICSASQGQRLGELLLLDALTRIVKVSESIGIHAIEVLPINDNAAQFYLKYGFTALLDDPHHLYISLKTVKKLGLI